MKTPMQERKQKRKQILVDQNQGGEKADEV